MALQNSGLQGWKVLEQIFSDTSTLTGKIMPNIEQISPQAIIDGSVNTITYNDTADVAPTGGINGNIWYNEPSDVLYKKIAGTWTILTDRLSNDVYVAPVTNLTDCPIPA